MIDAMTSTENMAQALRAFREICEYPIKGVVYSHSHGDHWGGSPALVRASLRGSPACDGWIQSLPREFGGESGYERRERVAPDAFGVRAGERPAQLEGCESLAEGVKLNGCLCHGSIGEQVFVLQAG